MMRWREKSGIMIENGIALNRKTEMLEIRWRAAECHRHSAYNQHKVRKWNRLCKHVRQTTRPWMSLRKGSLSAKD